MGYSFGDNVSFVKNQNPDLFKEYIFAEKNIYSHPYLSLNRLRVIFEELTNKACQELHLKGYEKEPFAKRLSRLSGRAPDRIIKKIETLRPVCNAASHEMIDADGRISEKLVSQALEGLSAAREFAYWYYVKIAKKINHTDLPEFIRPPLNSFEEELVWAHEGDAYSALSVAEHHRYRSLEALNNQDYHERLSRLFLDYSCDKGVIPALEWKAALLILFGSSVEEIRGGISICDILIKNGIVINTYCNKAIAFSKIKRKHTSINILKKGIENNDPYSMNLYVQWSGHPENEIYLSENECSLLLEKSLSIAFNSEAAYYLSFHYEREGEALKAIEVLEDAVSKSADDRGLLESRLGELLVREGENVKRGLSLIAYYAEKSFYTAMLSVETLMLLGFDSEAVNIFVKNIKTASQDDIAINKNLLCRLQENIIESAKINDEELFIIMHFLDEAE